MSLDFDPDDSLVEMPLVGRRWPITPDPGGEPVAEAVHPVANCLVGNRDAPFRQSILYVAQAQSKLVVGPDVVTDDTLRKPEAFDPRQIFDVKHGAELHGRCDVSNLTKPCFRSRLTFNRQELSIGST